MRLLGFKKERKMNWLEGSQWYTSTKSIFCLLFLLRQIGLGNQMNFVHALITNLLPLLLFPNRNLLKVVLHLNKGYPKNVEKCFGVGQNWTWNLTQLLTICVI